MKTLSPQILAFYLGCEVELNSPREKIVTGFIQEIDVTGNCIMASMEITRRSNIRRIKPLLRKLSSMTEEEAQQLLTILFEDKSLKDEDKVTADEIDVDLHPNDDALMVDGDMALVIALSCRCYEGQLGITLNGSLVLYNEAGSIDRLENTVEAFAFLLSKHFDLFNLIENNLAIDKDTLK